MENSNDDALTRLATSKNGEMLKLAPIEVFKAPTIEGKSEVIPINRQPRWKDPIIKYLVDGELLEDR